MLLVRKLLSPEVQIVKESIEEFCIAKEMSRVLAMSAFMRAALAHYVYTITNMGYNVEEAKAIIKRLVSLTLDVSEFEEKK